MFKSDKSLNHTNSLRSNIPVGEAGAVWMGLVEGLGHIARLENIPAGYGLISSGDLRIVMDEYLNETKRTFRGVKNKVHAGSWTWKLSIYVITWLLEIIDGHEIMFIHTGAHYCGTSYLEEVVVQT